MKNKNITYEIQDSFAIGQKIVLTGILIQGEILLGDIIKFKFNDKYLEREIKGLENGIKVTEEGKKLGIIIDSFNDNEIEAFNNWKPNNVIPEII